MDLDIEFITNFDYVDDVQDLILNDDNIYDYSFFTITFKCSPFTELIFSADSLHLSIEEISDFIQKLSQYENDIDGKLFENSEYYSVYLKDKKITFSSSNYNEGFANVSFIIQINTENIVKIINIFDKLLKFKKKFEDLYNDDDLSDIECEENITQECQL